MAGKNKTGIAHENDAKQRILDAGINLFAEKGYPATSVREIVSRAGVTKPVLYYHFQNKEGLFRAILKWAAQQMQAMLSDALGKKGDALERLSYLYKRFYEGMLEHRNLAVMIHNLIFSPPQGLPKYDFELFHRPMVDAIGKIYRQDLLQVDRDGRKGEDVAIIVMSLIEFCFNMDHALPDSADLERPARLLQLVFKGINPTYQMGTEG